MAQWNGQFTGNSHATKVDDLELTLEKAIEAFKTCPDELRSSKGKSVTKLASKVLNARLKLVKAKRNDAEPVEAQGMNEKLVEVEHLREREKRLADDGVEGILREFGVPELADETLS